MPHYTIETRQRVLLYIAATSFSRDTDGTDFLPIVSYVRPNARRDGMLPCIHLSGDSASGHDLANDMLNYFDLDHTELTEQHHDKIRAYCNAIILAMHDPDLPPPPKRCLLY